jgi:4-hydroxy-tetrahydrodipicolinate synthase
MFRGSIPALITPFADGRLDEDALAGLVEWHLAEGSHGLVPVGTTGESPTLSHEEHERVIEIVVRTVAGRIPVIAGAGSNSTAEAIRLIRFAAKVGADAALVVTPYYNKPNQRGLLHHYRMLHDAAELPIFIYNIPGRSVIDMTPATMGELAQLPRIVGVKDATGDIGRGSDLLRRLPKGFAVYSGAAAPGAALTLLGKCSDEVRSPMVALEEPTRERVRAAMRHAGLLN